MLVALRKESVDRNAEDWLDAGTLSVALRKESVDRNNPPVKPAEIGPNVALRKESVDRNDKFQEAVHLVWRRSPQGERG